MMKEDRDGLKTLQKELAFVGFVELIRADPQMVYLLADAYVDLVKSIAGDKVVVRPGDEGEYAEQKAAIVAMLKKVLPGLEVVTPEEADRRDAEDAKHGNDNTSDVPPKGTILN